jgi:Uma2 family endonuclease
MTVIADDMPELPPRLKLTAEDFYRMGEVGLFRGRNVILIEGELIDMPAEGARHFSAIHRALKSLEGAYGPGFVVRRPGPLELSMRTDPEPDVSVVRGTLDDFTERHPTTAELVLEVSETTLRYDRKFKVALYAQARIPEYWIVILPDQVVEVYRAPTLIEDEWRYASKTTYRPGELVVPPSARAAIDVGSLMV